MRVALVDHTAVLSGAEIALVRLVQALDRDTIEPVAVLFSDGPLREHLQAQGVAVTVVPLGDDARGAGRAELLGGPLTAVRRVVSTANFALRLRRALRALDVDVVHTTSLKADVLGGIAARSLGLPLVWHVHDRIADDYLPERVARMFRWGARRLPSHVIANSHATLETLLPLQDGKYSVAYPGLGADAFATRTAPVRPEGSPPTVGIIGRIGPTKGQEFFLRAAATVAHEIPDARFRVIGGALFGEDDYERRMHALPRELGIEGLVEFTGVVDDVRAELDRLDLVVHASPVPEPFGQVLVEAMAAGVPVVATDAGGVAEIVQDGSDELGVLVPPGDDVALATAMQRTLQDAGAVERAARARRSVQRRFRIEDTARTVESVWRSLVT